MRVNGGTDLDVTKHTQHSSSGFLGTEAVQVHALLLPFSLVLQQEIANLHKRHASALHSQYTGLIPGDPFLCNLLKCGEQHSAAAYVSDRCSAMQKLHLGYVR